MDKILVSDSENAPKGFTSLKVLSVKHHTDQLFSFELERPDSLRFRSGEFVMIGLMNNGKPLVRAYSIASPSWGETLEFYSIKVADGPLTSKLQNIKVDDYILLRPKPVGTLVHDALIPGKRLFLFSTGTGIAPFASVIRDPETYDKFDQVILTQTTRTIGELQYGKDLIQEIRDDELLSEVVGDKLQFIATTTQEESELNGRISLLIEDGRLQKLTGGETLNRENDRVMICGSMAMLETLKELCENLSFVEGANSAPGEFVIEKAFVT